MAATVQVVVVVLLLAVVVMVLPVKRWPLALALDSALASPS